MFGCPLAEKGGATFLVRVALYRRFVVLSLCLLAMAFHSVDLIRAQNSAEAGATHSTEPGLETIRHLHEELIAIAEEKADRNILNKVQRLRPVIRETHDLDDISSTIMGKYWDGLSKSEQTRFKKVFTDFITVRYVSEFRQPTFSYSELQSQTLKSGRMLVQTQLKKENEKEVTLKYILHETDVASSSDWQIINIISRNVSDLAIKRSEYTNVMENSSLETLLKKIKQRTYSYMQNSG